MKQAFFPVDPTAVRLSDPVFAERVERCRNSTIPSSVTKCRETGRIDAFRLAWKEGMPNRPHIFWDSDFAKVLEGMALALAQNPEDKELAAELDGYVDLVISAQQPDGYLNTYFTQVEPDKRWSNIFEWHELYCAGHLMEAAVAHFRATGNRKFLDTLCRYADYIATVFGTEPTRSAATPTTSRRSSEPNRANSTAIPDTRRSNLHCANSPTRPENRSISTLQNISSTNAVKNPTSSSKRPNGTRHGLTNQVSGIVRRTFRCVNRPTRSATRSARSISISA